MSFPSPHGDKLRALLANEKLPSSDRPRVLSAISVYEQWIGEIEEIQGTTEDIIDLTVRSLNRYKNWIDLDLVFDSQENFLYRQKGQLKLDNSVLEEFLPRLIGKVFGEFIETHELILGPANAFSQLRFDSEMSDAAHGGGMEVRSKDHDFALARPLFLKASHSPDFAETKTASTNLAYLAAEIKTNLDKTMFQEASATALDLKIAVPSSRYILICEWLDMIPISTSATMIEEVIVLRRARRLPSNIRRNFSSASGRSENRRLFEEYLTRNPLTPDGFKRLVFHVEVLMRDSTESENDALTRGWF